MTDSDVVILPVNDAVMAKTTANVIKKFGHTDPGRMYGRTPVELLDNIFMGDLAKNSLFEYLKPQCDSEMIDYDEIRTDNFRESDPGWDLKAGLKQMKIEVKSSIPTNSESRQSIINKRDIKITASHDKGNTWIKPDVIESEIHVQVYFYAKPYKRGFDQIEGLLKELQTGCEALHRIINSKKYSKPLFFGWNKKQSIIHYAATLQPNTWSFGKTSRIYWRCPLKEALTLPQLVEYINAN